MKMWARFHSLDIRRIWAFPFWAGIISIISLLWVPEEKEYISWIVFWLAVGILLISLLLITPYKVWKRDMDDLRPLKELREKQRNNEKNYLYLGIGKVDLGTEGRQISVLFQIYSGLVYDFQPYRMWITLNLGSYRPGQHLHEMITAPKLYQGSRYGFGTITINIDDDELLKRIEGIRSGTTMEKELWIEIQPESGGSTFLLKESF